MSGLAFLIPGADYSSYNLGQVTPTQSIPVEAIAINGPGNVLNTAEYKAAVYPAFTTQNGVSWSVVSGSEYATISSSGLVTAISGASQSSVTIRATSTSNPSVYADKTISVTAGTIVYYNYILSDGTGWFYFDGVNSLGGKVTLRCTLGGENTYSMCALYNESSGGWNRLSAHNNSSNKASAYCGSSASYNVATKENINYRYVWNCSTTSSAGDGSFYLYNDSTNAVIGSKTSINVRLYSVVTIFSWSQGAIGAQPTSGGSLSPTGAKFYEMKVEKDGDVLAHWKPCTLDGEVAIHEIISGKIILSQNGSGLTVG